MVKVTILQDDRVCGKTLVKCAHGLSLLVEYDDNYILFDAGLNQDILQYNVEKLNVDLEILDYVVISHPHVDHFGGLPYVGWVSPGTKVYVPYGCLTPIGRLAKQNDLIPVEVYDWTQILDGAYVSKSYNGPPWEHFMVLRSNRGLIVFTGCMHPGVSVLEEFIERFGEDLYCVVGGLHLQSAQIGYVEKTVDKLFNVLNVNKVIPLHCTGGLFIDLVKGRYGDRIIETCCGGVVKL